MDKAQNTQTRKPKQSSTKNQGVKNVKTELLKFNSKNKNSFNFTHIFFTDMLFKGIELNSDLSLFSQLIFHRDFRKLFNRVLN